MKIGNKIREIRDLKGLSQKYMAIRMGITTQSYSKLEAEKTKMTFDKVEQIAKILEVHPMDIVNFESENIFHNTFNNNAENNHSQNFYNRGSKEEIEGMIQLMQKQNEMFWLFLKSEFTELKDSIIQVIKKRV